MTLYEKILQAPQTIRWKDILSDCGRKHTKQDMELAFIAGTSIDSANRGNMLLKWQQPWLFGRVALGGFLLTVLMLGLQHVLTISGSYPLGYQQFITYIIPMIVPVVLLIFFWELNVPRNISVLELGGSFLFGAAICFFMTFFLFRFIPQFYVDFDIVQPGLTQMLMEEAGYDPSIAIDAPLREEPAKLAAVLLLLFYFSRKNSGKKVYGFTGLAVGAAVGAAFSAYESINYGMMYGMQTVLLRAVYAVAGHVLFCAPYAAALALHMEHNRFSVKSFLNRDFIGTFAFSVFMHALWNSGLNSYLFYIANIKGDVVWLREFLDTYFLSDGVSSMRIVNTVERINQLGYAVVLIVTIGLWISTRAIVRKCFAQIGKEIPVTYTSSGYVIRGISGVFAGKEFSLKTNEIMIGTGSDCKLGYPLGTAGIGVRNSKLIIRNGALYLADLGSSGGTWLNGKRIPAGEGDLLRAGDTFQIGSQKEIFQVL